MRIKNWNKHRNTYSISAGHNQQVRVIHSAERSVIMLPRKEYNVTRSGIWRPQYLISCKSELIGTLNHGYFQRKSFLETQFTDPYIFLHRSDLSFRVVNEKSECCLAYHAPDNGNIVVEYSPECPEINLLMGLGLIVYQDILSDYNSTMNLLLSVAS